MSGPVISEGDMPAFPISIPGCGDNGASGLTKREYIAAKCLEGMLANHCVREERDVGGNIEMRPIRPSEVASYAVEYADAILAALDESAAEPIVQQMLPKEKPAGLIFVADIGLYEIYRDKVGFYVNRRGEDWPKLAKSLPTYAAAIAEAQRRAGLEKS